MTAVFVGTGCACAAFGVIFASLTIGILVGVCRLKKFKARKKRCDCVHANVYYNTRLSASVDLCVGFHVFWCVCGCLCVT